MPRAIMPDRIQAVGVVQTLMMRSLLLGLVRAGRLAGDEAASIVEDAIEALKDVEDYVPPPVLVLARRQLEALASECGAVSAGRPIAPSVPPAVNAAAG